MKKILVLSGKGGTGKTTVASALIQLLSSKSFADCDVDAPNLHLMVHPEGVMQRTPFKGIAKAQIDTTLCNGCGECAAKCHFDAIRLAPQFQINPHACEGCGVCQMICPKKAITMEEEISGETYVYDGKRHFSSARLTMGAGASGKLVTMVKKNMKQLQGEEIAVIDGSPGIGCPVIASVSGVHLVLIVTEPTLSAMHDMERVLKTVRSFGASCIVCINKYDIDLEHTKAIIAYCQSEGIEVVGKLPYDEGVSLAINKGKSIAELDGKVKDEITKVSVRIRQILS